MLVENFRFFFAVFTDLSLFRSYHKGVPLDLGMKVSPKKSRIPVLVSGENRAIT